MANTFREQAEERFIKSVAFMRKADALLQDDLVYRSALADAVSAIKNMLQGYLLLRVAAMPPSIVTQRWQEVAASNRMPDLIQCCGEAGINLSGIAVEIKRLNNERNYRTHDDPSILIDPAQAQRALELARLVQRRIKEANQAAAEQNGSRSTQVAQPAAINRIAAVARAAASGQLGRTLNKTAPPQLEPLPVPAAAAPLPSPETPSPEVSSAPDTTEAPVSVPEAPLVATASSVAEPSPVADAVESEAPTPVENVEEEAPITTTEDTIPDETNSEDDAQLSGDTIYELPIIHREETRPRRRGWRAVAMLVAAALLLIVGAGAGAGVTLTGHSPSWLTSATQLLPSALISHASPTVTVAPTPTATLAPTPASGSFVTGAMVVTVMSCQSGATQLALTNTGKATLAWSVGSPDATSPSFALTPGASGAATAQGALPPGQSTTLYASDGGAGATYHIVVVAPAGALQLLAAATC